MKNYARKSNCRLHRFCTSGAEVLKISIGACFSSSPADGTLLSDSSNNELFIINLATVIGRGNSNSSPA
jgi:hypothetical protein